MNCITLQRNGIILKNKRVVPSPFNIITLKHKQDDKDKTDTQATKQDDKSRISKEPDSKATKDLDGKHKADTKKSGGTPEKQGTEPKQGVNIQE